MILEKVIGFSEHVVNISPVRWLQDPLAKYKKTSDYYKYEESVSKHLEELNILDNALTNNVFGITTPFSLAIYVFGRGGFNYDLQTPLQKKIFDRIVSDNSYSMQNVQFYNPNLKNYVIVSTVALLMKYGTPQLNALKTWCGYFIDGVNQSGYDLQTARDNFKTNMCGDINKSICVVFNTPEETKNCYESFLTTFAQWCCKTSVTDIHVNQKFLPWMIDYTKPWSNQRFCEYFGVDGFISDEEAVPNSEWDEILKSIHK